MAKKPTGYVPQWERPFDPIWVKDPYANVRGPWIGKWLIVGFTFEGFRAVGRQAHVDGPMMGVTHAVIPARSLRNYSVVDDENTSLQSILKGLKEEMLAHGATPLAVQWIGELSPFSEQEFTIMADKLTKPVKAAKAAPADKPKSKGNPEALAKANAARAEANAGPDKRKITVLKKPHGAREGTTRATLLDTIYKSKTVQDAVDAGVKKSDVAWAARAEYISIG